MAQPRTVGQSTRPGPDMDDYRARLEADLAIAERVHRSMIPANQRRGNLEIACDFRPMMGVGGDYASVHFQNDSARGVSVLFGGIGDSAFNDTWEWDGESWTQVSSTGPSRRYNTSMAHDERRGVSVLFGGFDDENALGDTWEWDGNSWTQVSVGGPPARHVYAMAYDSRRGVVVLFGGSASGTGAHEPSQSGDQVDEQDDRVAHRHILATSPGIAKLDTLTGLRG